MTEYTKLGSEVTTVVDDNGKLVKVIIIRFKWGENNYGEETIPKSEATPERINNAIQQHIDLIDAVG